jgi:hypothetical protein
VRGSRPQVDPEKAYAFLHGISGDATGVNDKTFHMLDDLGNNYVDTGHYPEGISVYRDLISRDKGPRVCGYQAHVTDATMALKSADKLAIKAEPEKQLDVAAAFKSSSYDKEAKQVCANRSAALVSETAMAWHLEAVGSDNQRGTSDARTMALAAALYKRVVDSWSGTELASFQFPRLVKADWPTLFKVKYAMADLLYFQKDWARCGPAFDSVVAEDPTGPEAGKAAYAAGLCYQNVYEASHLGDGGRRTAGNLPGRAHREATASDASRLEPKKLTPEQTGMVHAFDRYVCTIKPGASDAAGQEQLVEVKYARGSHVLRGAALGRSGTGLPRDRAEPLRSRRGCLRGAALSRERERHEAALRQDQLRDQYHVVDELRGAPTMVNSGLSERAAARPDRRRILAPGLKSWGERGQALAGSCL